MAEKPMIPILLFSPRWARRLRFLYPLGRLIANRRVQAELKAATLDEEPEQYGIAFVLSSFLWAVLMSGLVFIIAVYGQGLYPDEAAAPAAAVGAVVFAVFLALHIAYPSILARRIAEEADRKLIYVLRDLWVQSTSGVPLYIALSNIARGEYGVLSDEIHGAVSKISAGERDITVMEHLATTTRSEAVRRAFWDVITSMKTGLGLSAALENTLSTLTAEQRRKIKAYGASLNFYLLLYLLFAAVVPAIFTTFLALLSVFGILMISAGTLGVIVALSLVVQISLVGLMRAGRPEVGV